MIDMAGERGENKGLIGDPAPRLEADSREPIYHRGATDLVISLSAAGRTIRLFTADGDEPQAYYPTKHLDLGINQHELDR